MSDATSHAVKKLKTVPTGTPLYSDLDLTTKLTIDAIPQGANETKFATVKYDEARLVFQATTVKEPMRSPFGIDDGSKFGSKPSMKLELQDPQLAFVCAIEEKVITTAISASRSSEPATSFAAASIFGSSSPCVESSVACTRPRWRDGTDIVGSDLRLPKQVMLRASSSSRISSS